jgi:hypothetical protein
VVIRLNEIFPEALENDYGSRTDITFLNLASNALKGFRVMGQTTPEKLKQIKLMVCPRYSLHVVPFHENNFSHDQNIFKNFDALGFDNDFYHIGDEKNQQFEQEVGCHPNVGTLAIMTVLEYSLSQLYICGMSFYQTSRRYNLSAERAYITANKNIPPAHLTLPGGHNTTHQVGFLRNKLKRYDIDGDDYFKKIIMGD